MQLTVSPYHPSDLVDLYRICLRTGASGGDASQLYRDPDLLGHYYAAPYVVREPDLCFVLTNGGRPCGYILGTCDSAGFAAWCEQSWFPPLRQRYPLPPVSDTSPDAHMIRRIHAGYSAPPDLEAFPAHLHVDLLPEAHGQGWGRALVDTFLTRLRALNVPAVHLGVGQANARAIAFYERIGFQRLQQHPDWIAFGMRLAE